MAVQGDTPDRQALQGKDAKPGGKVIIPCLRKKLKEEQKMTDRVKALTEVKRQLATGKIKFHIDAVNPMGAEVAFIAEHSPAGICVFLDDMYDLFENPFGEVLDILEERRREAIYESNSAQKEFYRTFLELVPESKNWKLR
jgi:hypothetical protein